MTRGKEFVLGILTSLKEESWNRLSYVYTLVQEGVGFSMDSSIDEDAWGLHFKDGDN